jgi:hypothetical protein
MRIFIKLLDNYLLYLPYHVNYNQAVTFLLNHIKQKNGQTQTYLFNTETHGGQMTMYKEFINYTGNIIIRTNI